MHHTATKLPSNQVLVFGGRSSPMQAFNDCYLLHLSASIDPQLSYDANWTKIETEGDPPIPRWRHSATLWEDCVVIFGGKQVTRHLSLSGIQNTEIHDAHHHDSKIDPQPSEASVYQDGVLGDCYFLQIGDSPSQSVPRKWYWKRAEFIATESGMELIPRHSHESTLCSLGLIITGGIGAFEELIPDEQALILFSPAQDQLTNQSSQTETHQQLEWTALQTTPPFQSRFGHTAAMISSDLLLCIGGIAGSGRAEAELTSIIDLSTMTLHMLVSPSLQIAGDWLNRDALLINHTSVTFSGDDMALKVLIYGGGGNCFSFGTHLNGKAYLLSFTS